MGSRQSGMIPKASIECSQVMFLVLTFMNGLYALSKHHSLYKPVVRLYENGFCCSRLMFQYDELSFYYLVHVSPNTIFIWPRAYETLSCSTQVSMKFQLLMNIKIPRINGFLGLILKCH